MDLDLSKYQTKKELFKFLVENKDTLVAQKKAQRKEVACGVIITPTIERNKEEANKEAGDAMISDRIKVVAIINTTNLLDSHSDVHLPGIWKKTISENKFIMHVQEHKSNKFENIISSGDDLKVYTKNFTWKELGYDFEGVTEALVFESTVRKSRNEFMFKQYANGWVKNHSVGMLYMKMDIAINDDEYVNEFEAWKKYIGEIANKEEAEEKGFFWYVLEAKLIEGSSVPLGSNYITPTLEVSEIKEPPKSTREPENTHKTIDYSYLRNNFKL